VGASGTRPGGVGGRGARCGGVGLAAEWETPKPVSAAAHCVSQVTLLTASPRSHPSSTSAARPLPTRQELYDTDPNCYHQPTRVRSAQAGPRGEKGIARQEHGAPASGLPRRRPDPRYAAASPPLPGRQPAHPAPTHAPMHLPSPHPPGVPARHGGAGGGERLAGAAAAGVPLAGGHADRPRGLQAAHRHRAGERASRGVVAAVARGARVGQRRSGEQAVAAQRGARVAVVWHVRRVLSRDPMAAPRCCSLRRRVPTRP
jgi:hypothetical protein